MVSSEKSAWNGQRGIYTGEERNNSYLQDIVSAIEENDYVLMHDAITYGVMEYLKACNPELVEAE